MEALIKAGLYSLDNDLAALVTDRKANFNDCVQLQMLRIFRGRPFRIDLQPQINTKGWTADGVTFYPSAPGTFTTSDGVVPPTGPVNE